MKRLILILALAACTPLQQDNLTRQAASRVIKPVLADRFPGVPLDAAADCVIENATTPELRALASDAVTGPTAATVQTVSDILARPASIECLATEGLAPFAPRL
jgi:hypothetical protein